MNKGQNIFNTTLRLNLNKAQDREAWENLISADTTLPEYSSYSRTIITAINDHFSRMDRPEQNDQETALLKKIEDTIRHTIADCMNKTPINANASELRVSTPSIVYEPLDEDDTIFSDVY